MLAIPALSGIRLALSLLGELALMKVKGLKSVQRFNIVTRTLADRRVAFDTNKRRSHRRIRRRKEVREIRRIPNRMSPRVVLTPTRRRPCGGDAGVGHRRGTSISRNLL